MSSIVARENSVRSYLASQCMFVDDEWLSGCVEYLTENTSNLSDTELHSQAREQWLLNDLRVICPGCLPANIKEQRKTELNGRFVLQINAAMDIGTPAYQQHLKLQKINMENVEATTKFEDKIPSHRMIKLYLTDGKQDVSGIEYKPMRNLSCDITPGSKVMLKGPITCRRGVLLLTEASVELLGGEVEELASSNSLPALLSSKLSLPVVMEPDQNTTVTAPRNTNIPTPHTTMPPARTEPSLREEPFEPSRPVARVTSIQVADSLNDDDLDIDEIAAIEAQMCSTSNKRHSEELPNPEKKIRLANISNEYPEDTDVFEDEDEDYVREMEAQFDNTESRKEIKYPIPINSEPYVYIKQINEMKHSDKAGRVFKVKGQIMKLLSKLLVGKDGWGLKCTIVDGTGNIDVDFTSDVLSKLVGLTPNEMNNIKKEMANKPELKAKAVAALHKAKESLQALHCIIELTIVDTPKITSLLPFEETQAHGLKKRLEGSGVL